MPIDAKSTSCFINRGKTFAEIFSALVKNFLAFPKNFLALQKSTEITLMISKVSAISETATQNGNIFVFSNLSDTSRTRLRHRFRDAGNLNTSFFQFSQSLVAQDRRSESGRKLDHISRGHVYLRVQLLAHDTRHHTETQDASNQGVFRFHLHAPHQLDRSIDQR